MRSEIDVEDVHSGLPVGERVDFQVCTNVSEKYTASIFKAPTR